jgi:hypothetical protein
MLSPTDPAYWDAVWEAATPEQRDELRRLLDSDLAQHVWRAQVGRQSEAADARVDILGYGGSAGGGKTDLIAGLALTEFDRSVIFRREKAQTEGIIQRLGEILGSTDGFNSQKAIWRVRTGGEDRLIEFGGLDNLDDHQRWQGRPHALKAYDEATEMREFQVRFTMGWARTSKPGQRVLRLLTFNPPTTQEGRWVIKFFAPWLDDRHPRPAKAGEVRWFTTIKGEDVEVEDGRPFVIFRGEPLYDFDPADFGPEKIVTPLSRTFIPSRVTDNYFYVRSGYIQTLQSLPEPLRSQMLEGDFKAGIEDDEWQVIPTAWIDEAMVRWQPREAKGAMDSMGVDVAVGGKDKFVIARRHGLWFDELIRIPGHEIDQRQAGPQTAGHVIRYRKDRAPVHVDVIGWGLTTANFLTENEVQVVAVNAAVRSLEQTRDGKLKFSNMRAEMVWRMRETLDPESAEPAALPPDPALKADLAAYKWKLTASGIQVRSKDEMKQELGRSPDDGDAVCMANIVTMKQDVIDHFAARRPERAEDLYAELG